MADIAFYHLQVTPASGALPQLLGKSLQRGWRCVVEVGARDTLVDLDAHLWTFSQSQFLPHASTVSADGAPEQHADRQPIWLTTGDDNPNNATVRFFVYGALPRTDGAFESYERLVLMFDGAQEADVAAARTVWRGLREAGHALSYWQQGEDGGWRRADS